MCWHNYKISNLNSIFPQYIIISTTVIANVLSTVVDNIRYLTYTYTIGRYVWFGPLYKLLQHFAAYITYNVIGKEYGVVIHELYIQRDSCENHIIPAWKHLCIIEH